MESEGERNGSKESRDEAMKEERGVEGEDGEEGVRREGSRSDGGSKEGGSGGRGVEGDGGSKEWGSQEGGEWRAREGIWRENRRWRGRSQDGGVRVSSLALEMCGICYHFWSGGGMGVGGTEWEGVEGNGIVKRLKEDSLKNRKKYDRKRKKI